MFIKIIKKNNKKFLIFSLLFCFIFFINKLEFRLAKQLTNITTMFAYPFIICASKCSNFISYLTTKNSYAENLLETQKLKDENTKLLEENIKLVATLEFAQSSSSIREFQQRYKLDNAILAKIAIKQLNDENHYILINQGSTSGVEKDMIAIYHYQLIGRVSEVFPYHSKIILITDEKSQVAAYTSISKANGIVQGKNNLRNCSLAYTSHLFKIEPNELVISSGQGLVFPEGFCLGKITSAQVNGLCYEIEITPLVELEKIDFCLLLPKNLNHC